MIVRIFSFVSVLGVISLIQLCTCAKNDSTKIPVPTDTTPLPSPTPITLETRIDSQDQDQDHDLAKEQNRMNYFAFEACKFIFPSSGKDNLVTTVWSPFSVYSTLAPLYQGSGGSTLEELKNVMHIRGDDDLQLKLNQDSTDETSFKSFTGMFMSSNVHLDTSYKERVINSDMNKSKFVQTEIDDSMNFTDNLILSTNYINAKIKEATGGMIPQILSPNSISQDTRMVIANGVQFKGKWKNQFDSKNTKSAPFYGLKEHTDIDMMTQKGTFLHGEFQEFNSSVCQLEYNESSMVLQIILPSEGTPLASVWSKIKNREKLDEISQALEPKEMEINIPKMRIESEVPIQDTLTKMGLATLFIPQANLTNMFVKSTDKKDSLYVSKMIHKSVFEMDEEGTKAASSTAGILIPLSGFITQSEVFRVDRPFIFILKDSLTDTIIFMGCVTELANGEKQKEVPDRSNLISTEKQEQVTTTNREQFQEEEEKSNTDSVSISPPTDSPSGTPQVEDKWWIYTGDPEYLNLENSQDISTNDPKLKIITPRFQQPEPKQTSGIRFPFPQKPIAQKQRPDNGSTRPSKKKPKVKTNPE